jgi:predicted nucleotidyltransferase
MELFRKATELLRKKSVRAIVFFGSRVIGKYRNDSDLDVLIVAEGRIDLGPERLRFVKENGIYLDTTVMTEREFEENLTLGTVLMGVSLAFCVTYDEIGIYDKLVNWCKEVEKYGAVLILPYGRFVVGRTLRKCLLANEKI